MRLTKLVLLLHEHIFFDVFILLQLETVLHFFHDISLEVVVFVKRFTYPGITGTDINESIGQMSQFHLKYYTKTNLLCADKKVAFSLIFSLLESR